LLPIRDRNPSGSVPVCVYALIAVNTVVFLYEVALPDPALKELVTRFGMVPQRVTLALRGQASFSRCLLVPALTSMFLHGGWFHLLGNMWFLFIFGDNVEARLKHVPFLLFYVACGLGAAAAQYVLAPGSSVPTVGASGAIAGVLGAYAVTWPRARVLTLVPLFFFFTLLELPALLVLGLWFVMQLFEGAGSIGAQYASGGVAYWAHVGGFAIGAGLIKVFPVPKRSTQRTRPLPPRYWR